MKPCNPPCLVDIFLDSVDQLGADEEFLEADMDLVIRIQLQGREIRIPDNGKLPAKDIPQTLLGTVEVVPGDVVALEPLCTVTDEEGFLEGLGYAKGGSGKVSPMIQVSCSQEPFLLDVPVELVKEVTDTQLSTTEDSDGGTTTGETVTGSHTERIGQVVLHFRAEFNVEKSRKPTPPFEVEIQPADGMCLDVPDGTTDPVTIQGFRCHGGLTQRWFLEFDDQGMCSVRSSCSLRCLDIPNGDYGFVTVQQYACHGGDNQKWRLHAVYDNDPANPFDILFLQLRSPDEQWALYVDSNDNLLKLEERELAGGGLVRFSPEASLRFVVHPTDQLLLVVNRASGWCLDVPGLDVADGVQIQQFPIHRGENQLWRFEAHPRGGFAIRNLHSTKYLTVEPNWLGPSSVVQSAGGGSNVQRWRLVLTPSGLLQIRSLEQNRCLGVSGDNLIQAQEPDGSDSQLWQLQLP